MRPLSDALRRRQEPVDRDAHALDSLTFGSLNFSGEITPRNMERVEEVKGRLFFARTGDVVYSKIDVRNGAIGIVPPAMPQVAFSSEFPIYAVDPAVAVPDYVRLLFRTTSFRSRINSLISGASGRQRVEPQTLEEIIVPFPSPKIQTAIIAHWQKANSAVDAADTRQIDLYCELDAWLDAQTQGAATLRSCLGVSWGDLGSWTVQSARAAVFRQANPEFVPFGTFAEDATELAYPAEKPDYEWPVYGVNNQEGVVFSHHQKGAEFNSPYKRIQRDWFFHNPTRSAVGSLGHVPDVPADALTSPEYQVWRLRDLGADSLTPDFVALLIRTKWFVRVIQFHRVGAVKQRLYVENLLAMPVPKFPRALQDRLAAARKSIDAERTAATARLATTMQEIEEMILGTRPVPGA